jgi:hypothetical protein
MEQDTVKKHLNDKECKSHLEEMLSRQGPDATNPWGSMASLRGNYKMAIAYLKFKEAEKAGMAVLVETDGKGLFGITRATLSKAFEETLYKEWVVLLPSYIHFKHPLFSTVRAWWRDRGFRCVRNRKTKEVVFQYEETLREYEKHRHEKYKAARNNAPSVLPPAADSTLLDFEDSTTIDTFWESLAALDEDM